MDDDQENHKKHTLIKIKIQKYVEEKVDPIIGPRSNDGPRNGEEFSLRPRPPQTWHHPPWYPGPSDDLNGTIDLAKSLPSWPSTDRRGRQALTCSHDSSTLSEVEEEERIQEAVHDLMRLARGESLHQVEAMNSNSPMNRAKIEEYFSVKKLKIDEGGRGNISGGTGRVVVVKNLDRGKGKTDDGEEEGPNVDYNLGERVKIMSKKNRKKVKLINLESVSTPPERYKCSTCNKFFSTHQALGGHRSSHNKIKNDEDEHNANHAPTLVDEVVPKEIIEGGGSSSYKCKICNKSFPTGQALGATRGPTGLGRLRARRAIPSPPGRRARQAGEF
ncbi:hypothetical protein Acr_23g0012400 [Actinidia rufa]|uniref:C2H2-type domain-containing protein n=1 Tax=Actinidia rufa TaxID=165716 RepID=A0A7J0GPW3_9ERIC|nr:hypothetical protein Acr_23g0012400 [Actinidia rufa]